MTELRCDPANLSAYYDDELSEFDRRRVEDHLLVCGSCRERLSDYAWLGSAARAGEEASVPFAVDSRIRALLQGKEQSSSSRIRLERSVPRPAWAGALLAVLLLATLAAALSWSNGASSPLVAAAYLYDDQGEPAIEVRFTGAVNHESVAQSLQIEPAVDVTVAWRGDTMVVKPAQPLPPTGQYTLKLKPKGADSAATPVALQFAGLPPASAVALATNPPAPRATPPAPVTATRQPPATSTPVTPTTPPTATATAPKLPSTPTIRPVQLVRGFGALYRSRPEVAARLGLALESEHQVDMALQRFQGGLLAWRPDRKSILALFEDGQWRSYPDSMDGTDSARSQPGQPPSALDRLWRQRSDLRTSLGDAMSVEQPTEGTVEEFQHGILLALGDGDIVALYADSSWERYADSYREATSTASPTPTRGTSTPTAPPTATPTVTATPTREEEATATATATAPTATTTATATPPTATATTPTPTPAAPTATASPVTPALTPTATPPVATATSTAVVQ